MIYSFFIITIHKHVCFSFPDDQPFLPINPFAEPITTMSTANSNHHVDDDMIDIDFQNTTNDRSSSMCDIIIKIMN